MHKHFDSLHEYLDFCETSAPNSPAYGELRRSADDPIWSGARTMDAAMKLARYGWPEGLERVNQTHIKSIDDYVNPTTKLDVRYMDAPLSGLFDIGRVLENDPECWIEFEQIQEPSPRIVRFLIYGTFSGGLSTETIIRNGCALMGVIDALEQRGTRVHVDIGYTASPANTLTYTAKQSDGLLDREQLVYLIAHPSSSRWLMRSAFATVYRNWGSSSIEDHPKAVSDQYDIVTPRNLLGELDESRSVKWLLNILREKFGLEIN